MRTLIRYKASAPGIAAGIAFLFFVYATWRRREPSFAVLSVTLAAGLFVACRLLVEVVELLSDILLPK